MAGLAKSVETTVRPVAFIDDDARKSGRRIGGLPVFSAEGPIRPILKRYKAERVLIAMPSAPGRRIREIHQKLLAEEIPAWIVPGIAEIVESNEPITTYRQINPEDFLRRHPRVLGKGKIEPYFKNERVLVTGAGGTIGSELMARLATFSPAALAGADMSELAVYRLEESFSSNGKRPELYLADLSRAADVQSVFRAFRPTIVFHAAAYKHVKILESRARAAVLNNIAATRRLVEAAEAAGVHTFVHISTDKAVQPASMMGATKRVGELLVRTAAARNPGKKFISVRFGNVIGSSGSVFPKFIEQISKGGPVTVSDPRAVRYFMLTSEAVELVLLSAASMRGGGIYLLDIGEPIKIVDLVGDLIRFLGKTPGRDIRIEYTGLGPGEKLAERLSDSPCRETSEKNILEVIDPQKVSAGVVHRADGLLEAAEAGRESEVIERLSNLVPDYRPALPLKRFGRSRQAC
ncbi:polysaccharide biosynthesis protein [bacterium]|nr:polysaccharide biosynthesis protein [bacterium]